MADSLKVAEIRSPDRQGGGDQANCLNRSLTVAARSKLFIRCAAARGDMGNSHENPLGRGRRRQPSGWVLRFATTHPCAPPVEGNVHLHPWGVPPPVA